MKLRPYQQECIDKIIACCRSNQSSVLIKLPCGSGKTFIFSTLCKLCIENWNIKILIMVHRKILFWQTIRALESIGLNKGEVTVLMCQTAVRRDLEQFNMVIIDEVHRLPPLNVDSSYRKVIEMVNHDRLRLVGFTATPYRLKQGFLYSGKHAWFDQIDFERSLDFMVKNGYLCKMRYFNIDTGLDVSDIPKGFNGDYANGKLTERLNSVEHAGSIQKAIDKYLTDRKKIYVFCVSIKHCDFVAKLIGGTSVHSKSKGTIHDSRIICSVDGLFEGTDDPICDAAIQARPTHSPALYVQGIGRPSRLYPGKENFIILDLVGNFDRHQDPSNPNVIVAGEKSAQAPLRICINCGYVNPIAQIFCEDCGYDMREQIETERREIEKCNEELRLKEISTKTFIRHVHAISFTTKKGEPYLKVNFITSGGIITHVYPKSAKSSFSNKNWPQVKFAKIAKKCYGVKCESIDYQELFKIMNNNDLLPELEIKIKHDKQKKIVGF